MEPLLLEGNWIRIVLYQALFWPIVAYYCYDDAKSYEIERPRLYGAGVGFLGVPGIFIHFLLRDRLVQNNIRD